MGDEKEEDKKDEKEHKNVLLEKFKLAVTVQDNYNSLFWYRTSVFFAINAALFAGYALVATKMLELNPVTIQAALITLMLVFFGIVGAPLSWLWLKIHRRATFLQNYYRFRASVIEKDIGNEREIFGKSYKLASTDIASEKEWENVFGTEWKGIFRELVGKQWKEGEGESNKVPGSLRESLDNVYKIFIGVWIVLSLLGGVILLTILPRL